jgi:type II pantothenate kinase
MRREHVGTGGGDEMVVEAVGIDAGASLTKLAIRSRGEVQHRLLPAGDTKPAEVLVGELAPRRIGLTGGGASDLARRLGPDAVRVNEFAAWGAGAAALLEAQHGVAPRPFLLVSLGTGTSVMLADGMSVSRIGGTALGGGTVMGLGALLLGSASFEELCALAARGDRRNVDMLVSDIYRPGEIALTGDLTAANFGKPKLRSGNRPAPEDLAAAIMGLVGENVALICAGIAAPHGLRHVVFGGSTLRENQALTAVLGEITAAFGREAVFLERGEYAGAVGALELAAG